MPGRGRKPGQDIMTAAIETSGLTKTFGRTRAVTDLDLRVETGDIFGFLGPNGAGKTTTIRMLLALHRPTSGRAAVLGLDSAADGIAIHRRTGYLPGELALYPRMTGQRHIDWFARARGVRDLSPARELAGRFDAVLDRPARELSTGNRQKIGLILAFMARPELLVLDEPTTGLDPLMQHEFELLVREVAAEGRTVFLSSHELDEVQRLASRVAIIKDGRLITTQAVEDLRASAPRTMQVTFRQSVDPQPFAALDGTTVIRGAGAQLELEVTGPVGPLLRLIAGHDPVDLTARHADLDELFLGFYRKAPAPEASRAR
jgi:ABC-2 type transport system ATP-binding protein